MPPDRAIDVSRMAALAAWRVTQGVYRIDETLLEELVDSDLDGSLPVETLLHLPEWCVYVELPPGLAGLSIRGFWCHLEHDAGDGRIELRFLMHTETRPLLPAILHLGAGDGTIRAAIDAAQRETIAVAALKQGGAAASVIASRIDGVGDALWPIVRPMVSVVLYLCTLAEARPVRPAPSPGRKGGPPRWYPPDQPTTHASGERLGAELRAARAVAREPGASTGTGASTLPHVRRAHWHTYLLGARSGPQRRDVRWLPPILVGSRTDEAEPVVHLVLS